MKVLLISHNPISTYNNMGKTLLSLFSYFSSEELCQFYVFPSIPNTRTCCSYFRITDRNVLNSFFKLYVQGASIEPNNTCKDIIENGTEQKYHCTDKNKKAIRGLTRDVIWQLSHWFTKDLKTWIKQEKPSCIVLTPGNAKFIYKIAVKIAKKYNLPLILYICDDYYFVKKPTKFLDKIKLCLLKNVIRQTIEYSSHIITICDELKEIYEREFNIPTTTIMTGINIDLSTVSISESPKSINYFGNISINRNYSIADIGRIIDEINFEKKTKYVINVYTAEKNRDILAVFNDIQSIKIHDFLSGDEYRKAFSTSGALLHVEAFDELSIERVKNSVSTKIAESLASGIPLFAYGPASVASMKHLIKHNCAIIATEKGELKEKLILLFEDRAFCKEIVCNALETAENEHNELKNSNKLYKIIQAVIS